MATEIIETWICDITGAPAVQEEIFAIGTDEYEIDLSEDEDKKYWDWAGYYIKRGRLRPRRSEAAKSSKERPGVQVHHGKARKWAQSKGIPVNLQGAVPQEVIDAFVQAWLKDEVPEQWR